ncbi:MAG TPA: hypothetical protein RMH99_11965 [Sandaracinaceae bacterium LLY-WYZ-13_1]|nr:hypothetical protein [Sandaracinaceae bacterium LLY-WYZ-13_1]
MISSAPIGYEIVGEAAGSRLGALETTTSTDGEASMGLTAGEPTPCSTSR